jgi:GNAT superfamily N-acetyltransferase
VHEPLVEAFALLYTAIDGSSVEDRPGYRLFRCPAVPVPLFNAVWADGDEAVEELESALAELPAAAVVTREGLTPAVEAHAARLGLTGRTELPGMAVRARDLSAPNVPGLTIEQVADPEGLAIAHELAHAGFGLPEALLTPTYTPAAAALPGIAYYVGRVGGEPVSTAVGVAVDGSVGVFSVATPPGHRRHGYGAALTARAALDAFATGAEFAWLQASPLGVPVYRRLGFETVERYVLLSEATASL